MNLPLRVIIKLINLLHADRTEALHRVRKVASDR